MIDAMPRKLPPFVSRERTRHGRVVFYFRRGKGERVRLPGLASPNFEEAYQAALAGRRPPIQASKAPGTTTLAWLIAEYKASAHYARLKLSTRKLRDDVLRNTVKTAGDKPFASISRKHIVAAMDRRKPHAADTFRKTMSQLFKWAVARELVKANPCIGISRASSKGDGFHSWTPEEVARFHLRWPVGTRERLAMDLMLYTGLRRSDICRVGRQHVRDGVISIRMEKTGKSVHIPICASLQESIDATPTGDLAFVTTPHGKPFASAASFGIWFRKVCKAANVPGRAHGLRKAGASIAAENGATTHELMAMYGWSNLAQAEVYTKAASQRVLSRGAAERIATAMARTLDPGAGETPKINAKSKVK